MQQAVYQTVQAVQVEPAVQRQPVVISSGNRPNTNAKMVRAEKSAAAATPAVARGSKQAKVAKANKASDSWIIQLGAYKTKTTAQKILREAASICAKWCPATNAQPWPRLIAMVSNCSKCA